MNNLDLLYSYNVSDKKCNESVQFTISQEQLFILRDRELSVYGGESLNKKFTVFKGDFLNTKTSIKELFGKYIAFGRENEIATIDYTNGKTESFPIAFDTIAWSDASHFAILSGDEVSTYMFHDMDTECDVIKIATASIFADKPKHQYINLGWGSETTQFKGRNKRKKNEEEEKINYDIDSRPTTIIWSQSNDMFLINFFNASTQKRQYKIFSSECNLLYNCPEIGGMQAVLGWKPPHSLIAVPVSIENKLEIQFYEKIGPIRDTLLLRDSILVKEMLYSNDGMLLGILQEDDTKSILSIFMTSLGRWYLKQYFVYSRPQKIESFHVSQSLYNDKIYQLCVCTNFDMINYYYKTDKHSTPIPYEIGDKTASAIIDGNLLEMYLFSKNIIPPGMAETKFDVNNPINGVKFHSALPHVMCVDCYGNLHVFNYLDNTKLHEIKMDNDNFSYPNFFWKLDNSLEFYETHLESDKTIIKDIEYDAGTAKVINTRTIDFPLCRRKYARNSNYVVSVYKNAVAMSKATSMDKIEHSVLFDTVPLEEDGIVIDGQLYLFTLLENKRFYLNYHLLSYNVNSYVFHDEYLHYTNCVKHKMYTIILNDPAIKKILNYQITRKNAIGRRIENNAALVTGIPSKPDIILQMPRGNLENIKVELIMLHVIEDIIKVPNQWNLAHDLIRMQKMDANILIDLNIKRFMSSIPEFLSCIKSPNLICQFIQELSPTTNSCKVYFQFYPELIQGEFVDKVETICKAIIQAISKSGSYCDYLLALVCACIVGWPPEELTPEDYVNHSNKESSYEPPPVCEGLLMAYEHLQIILQTHPDKKGKEAIATCINYLTNQFTDKQLFTLALETCNIKFANIVADILKKDPKEYRPVLAHFSKLNSIELPFEIYKHLYKFDTALIWLLRFASVDQIVKYIDENDLLTVSTLGHIPLTMPEFRTSIMEQFAENSTRKNKHLLAFCLYKGLKKYSEAYKSLLKMFKYVDAYHMLDVMEIDKDAETQNLIAQLENMKSWDALSLFYKNICKDDKKLVEMYLASGQYLRAYDAAKEFGLNEYDDPFFENVVKTTMQRLSETLATQESNFKKYSERIVIVRATKAVSALMEEEEHETLYAESVTTTSSTKSKQSKQTSRQRKRMEKKLTSIRPGSQYEDIGLMRALYLLIEEIFNLKYEAKQAMHIAYRMSTDVQDCIKKFVQSLYNLQNEVIKSIDSIWCKEDLKKNRNYRLMENKYMKPPNNISIDWVKSITK